MAYKSGYRTLSGDIPDELYDSFDSQRVKRGQVKKDAITAMTRLWVTLPEDIQARLMNQDMMANAFIELVQQVVDDRIAAGREAAKSLIERQKQTQPQED